MEIEDRLIREILLLFHLSHWNGNLEIAVRNFHIFRSLCSEPEKFRIATKWFGQRGNNEAA
jgi:hypothetical protein